MTGEPETITNEPIKANCAQCSGTRNCDVFGKYSETYNSDHFDANTDWLILKCQGCDYVFVQTVSINSEDVDHDYDENGQTVTEYNQTIKYWPALPRRKKPDWISEFGIEAPNVDALNKVVIEIYNALENDLLVLSAIGIRTAFDIASELLGVDPNLGFEKKLTALVTNGQISSNDKDRLSVVVEAGSASAHRGWHPSTSDLNSMMSILEHFLYQSFVAPAHKEKLDKEAAKIKKVVPPRSESRG